MKNHRALWSVFYAAALVSIHAARADDTPITVARTYKAGDSAKYRVTVNTSAQGMDLEIVAIAKNTVKEIKKNGDVVMESAPESTTLNGTAVSGEEKPITETRTKTGKLVDLKTDSSSENPLPPEIQRMSSMVSEVIFPEKPVKPGDSWETLFDNPAVKGKKLTVKTTFVGTDKVDGTDLWKIQQAMVAETGADGNKVSHDYTVWLDPANGWPVKVDGTIKGIPVRQIGPMDWKVKMELVKDK